MIVRNDFEGKPMVEELELEGAESLPLLPLKNVVLLPKSILPVIVGRASSIKAVEAAGKGTKIVFVTAQKDPNVETPDQKDLYTHGTRALILQTMRMSNGSLKILVEGLSRGKMTKFSPTDEGFYQVHVEELTTPDITRTADFEATWRTFRSMYETYTKLNEKAPQDLLNLGKIDRRYRLYR